MADESRPRPTLLVPVKRAGVSLFTVAVVLIFLAGSIILAQDKGDYVATKEGRRACIEGALFLRVPLQKKGGVPAVAKRFTGGADNAADLLRASRLSATAKPSEVRIPLDLLLPEYRDEVLSALFPEDERAPDGWRHAWGTGPRGAKESWQDIARWFCGTSKRAEELRKANPKAGGHPKTGTVVFVPEHLLCDALAEIEPPAPAAQTVGAESVKSPAKPAPPQGEPASGPKPWPMTAPLQIPGPAKIQEGPSPGPSVPAIPPTTPVSASLSPQVTSLVNPLTYGRDEQGDFAVYHLQAGEALYSSVVVRFTGTVGADDVNALAMDIARRSGIADVTGIPVGYGVKIPLDDLLPQYLPPSSPRYQAWAKNRTEMKQVTNTYKNSALDGVVVILDPGHGGVDRGAMAHGVWEDSYVYDIACRMREAIERRTKARVLMTLLSPSLGYKPVNGSELRPNKDAVILTHPWFKPTSSAETKIEVNLRWHLGNQYFERLQKEGVEPQRVVFTSIHADSLHPSLRGTMFYIAGTDYRSERWCSSGESYERFKEVKAAGCYQMTERAMKRSEGLSYQFTRALEGAFADASLTLHPYDPTRDHVVRGRRSWVPAVLRNSIVPCSVLIEVCNLNNVKDAALLSDPAFRQAVAEAYVDALIRYYS